MLTATGRPRKACGTCKAQKIRCSGERPSCKRCLRLGHACVYHAARSSRVSSPQISITATDSKSVPSFATTTISETVFLDGSDETRTVSLQTPSPIHAHQYGLDERYFGIPKALLSTLVELYFTNVYNAHLLLHKRSFLRSVSVGAARAHIVYSVCAWGASFYRDASGQATLKSHGFMTEWAERASKLVFQDLHDFHEESLVTLVNLTIFWHSQGSWKLAALHKGSACIFLAVIGVGSGTSKTDSAWDVEVRRRRSWAVYLMHCHNSESMSSFPIPDMNSIALPWPEADFETGRTNSALVTLSSSQSNGGVFAELIRVITLWSAVVSCIKMVEPSLATRLPKIYALQEKLWQWWRRLPSTLRLTPDGVAMAPKELLPQILLINVVYHQCLCALHASIVPLFSWGMSDDAWTTARQLSAQIAYDHACITSDLLNAVLTTRETLSAMPSFISYGAYCGCAIQIPFMWSSNRITRDRAHANVKTNVKMINMMSEFWKFAALLKIYVRCLYNAHRKNPAVLEDEPKYVDAQKLTEFKMNAPHVQASILEFSGILCRREHGYVNAGEEVGLEIETDNETSRLPAESRRATDEVAKTIHPHNASIHPSETMPFTSSSESRLQQDERGPPPLPDASFQPIFTSTSDSYANLSSEIPLYQSANALADGQTLDIFQPMLAPEMLDLFPHGDFPDLSAFDTSPLNLDHFELDS